MLTPERLKEIKQRAERATKGPWGVRHLCSGCTPEDDEGAGLGLELIGPPQPWLEGQFARAADAQFCAHARDDIPDLVAEVERLWELRDELRGLIDFLRRQADGLRRLARERTTDAEGEAALYGHVDGLEMVADALERLGG